MQSATVVVADNRTEMSMKKYVVMRQVEKVVVVSGSRRLQKTQLSVVMYA